MVWVKLLRINLRGVGGYMTLLAGLSSFVIPHEHCCLQSKSPESDSNVKSSSLRLLLSVEPFLGVPGC